MKVLTSGLVFCRHTVGSAIKAEGNPAYRRASLAFLPYRTFSMTSTSSSGQTKDWSADQYLKFEEERTRPVRDLLAQIPIASPRRVVDLGCGPGNSTSALLARWPNAHISGMDSSPDMIQKAQKSLPQVQFELADLMTWIPPQSDEEAVDVFFSNAVFHWIPQDQRLPLLSRYIEMQRAGGVFAFQVPDNYFESSHASMREIAGNGSSWTATLKGREPAIPQFPSPQEIYDHLNPLCQSLNIWHTYFYHVLDSHEAVVEWVKGSGLRPFIDPLGEEERKEFVAEYLKSLKDIYPVSKDGKVILRYPRLFVVAVRK